MLYWQELLRIIPTFTVIITVIMVKDITAVRINTVVLETVANAITEKY